MAEFTYKFKSMYSFDTYDDVIKTYAWLKGCIEYVFSDISNLEIGESFNFSAQYVDYSCNSISEFQEYAFGHDIQPDTIFIHAKSDRSGWNSLAHFWAKKVPEQKDLEIVLKSDNKQTIAAIKDYLLLDEVGIEQLPPPKLSGEVEETNTHHGDKIIKENKSPIDNKIALSKEFLYTKIFWYVIIPIFVLVIGTAICRWLGIL